MSASPKQLPSGPSSVTPNGGGAPPPRIRKRAPASIFARSASVRPKQPLPGQAPVVNGAVKSPPAKPAAARPLPTGPSPDEFQDYPIMISKSALTAGLRYHAMKIYSKTGPDGNPVEVNPYDEAQFTRPVRLHRRNVGDKQEIAEQSDAASGVDDKDREVMNARRAERQAEKEANQALIAPAGEPSKIGVVRRKKQQKKVEEVMYDENNPKQKAKSQLRYEESRPWHLEDFDNKNKWVGSYQEPLSRNSIMISVTNGAFNMVPVEKWYKMIQANRIEKRVDAEKVEKAMEAKHTIPKWMLGNSSSNRMAMAHERSINRGRAQQRPRDSGGDEEDGPKWANTDDYQADQDGIDFDHGEEFQDDDEGFLYGDAADEEAKDIEKRIFEEMRGANLPDANMKDEGKDWDEEERKAKISDAMEKKKQKRLRKQLKNKERRNEYESDSERGEFSESSDEEDSEEEAERLEEERKKEEVAKTALANGDKSGASTKGSNTPTGRIEKKIGNALKREADLSEASGNESSRKKAKGVNGRAMSPGGHSNGRALSPADANSRFKVEQGSGSDTDTSRVGKSKNKLHLKNSPPGSRSGTPSAVGSRAHSPQRAPFPTLEDVCAAIPAEGIEIGDLVKIFRARVIGRTQEFILLVKKAGKQEPGTKLIKRLATAKMA